MSSPEDLRLGRKLRTPEEEDDDEDEDEGDDEEEIWPTLHCTTIENSESTHCSFTRDKG